MCVVEVEGTRGQVASCTIPVRPDMVINTVSESVEKTRIENIDVFYAYGLTLLLVILVVFSAMSFA